MHAIDRLTRAHEAMQGLQHEAVAAERDDDVGALGRYIAVAPGEPRLCVLCLGDRAIHEGDALERLAERGDFLHHGSSAWDLRQGQMERAILVYTTYPSIVEAERAGRAIVEARLAACVNILPGMISHYWWQGAIEGGDAAYLDWLMNETREAGSEPPPKG